MKRLLAGLLCAVMMLGLLCSPALASTPGDGNLDGGGGGMGQGTSSNSWNPGNDGVRITVVDAESGAAASSPLDFSNRAQAGSLLHFGKVSKLEYRSGRALAPGGGAYTSIKPGNAMPTIIRSSGGANNIAAVKKYFCSEYAVQLVADNTGISYDSLISGKYKLLIEPLAYV